MTGRSRGQSDVRTLLVFVVGITVVLAVAPAALGLAGIDIRDGSPGDAPAQDGGGELADGSLLVLSTLGHEVDDDRTSVGVVELLVTPTGDAVELDEVTVTWNGSDSYELAPAHVGTGDASFGVETLDDGTTLQPSERALLRFDLGNDDVEGLRQFGDRLGPGDTVTVTITTGSGAEATETLTVPDPLPPGSAVRLL